PVVQGAAVRQVAAAATITGYEGQRRRVLVVDNEESDRELIARWLQPLGFEVQMATSGHDALALLDGVDPAGERAPHAIFIDLAMPGIDGWETLRRLRASGWRQVPMAIVSANAFDKGLQADAQDGRPADQAFFVKPVRRDDLTGWLAQQLGLRWVTAPAAPVAETSTPAPMTGVPASPGDLEPLLELVRLGYAKGVLRWLDDWVAEDPARQPFADGLRALAREFRFEAIEQRLLQLRAGEAASDSTP
ncbi:MAG: response regulator, partial [Hydrogenophaga sp.]|nr:response regulator [Hydrogenophaga sp.]